MLYFAEIHLHYVYSQMLVKDRFFNIIWTSVIVHIILLTLLLQKSELLKTKEDNESLHKMIEGMRCIFILTVQSLVTHNLRGLSYTAKYYDWVWTIVDLARINVDDIVVFFVDVLSCLVLSCYLYDLNWSKNLSSHSSTWPKLITLKWTEQKLVMLVLHN